MKYLTRAAFLKARRFLLESARPLERCLYLHHFENGPKQRVWDELGSFQNSDGGFGNALESDLRTPTSSALCTSIAMEIFTELEARCEEPMVKMAVDYLVKTFDRGRKVWRIIPEDLEQSAHAPWWNQNELEATFAGFMAIPRAKLCGSLIHYQQLLPSGFLDTLLDDVFCRFEREDDHIFGDSLRCYLFLYQSGRLPQEMKDRMHAKLERMILASVETDAAKWDTYCLRPLWAVNAPTSPFYHLLASSITANLDYEVDHQCEDGSWKPQWSWHADYPAEWELAEREWRGRLTLDMLSAMRPFGRIEGQGPSSP